MTPFVVNSRYLPGKRYGWLAKKEDKEKDNTLPTIIGGKYKIERQLSGTDKKTYQVYQGKNILNGD